MDAEGEMKLPAALSQNMATASDREEHGAQPIGGSRSSPPVVKESHVGQTSKPREQKIVTVDAFLRRRKVLTKKYGKKRAYRQLGIDDINPKDTNTDEQAMGSPGRKAFKSRRLPISCKDESGLPSRPRRRGTQASVRPLARPLKERLYVAAVSTRGSPEDCYAQTDSNEAENSGRLPLRFVPISETEAERQGNPQLKALFVDPRKSMVMRTASLSFRRRQQGFAEGSVLASTLDRLPLSKWNLSFKNGGQPRRSAPKEVTVRKQRKVTEDMAHAEGSCPPLQFISFQEAEEKFKIMFQGSASIIYIHIST